MSDPAPLLIVDGPAGGGRVIVIGDIHGCIDELRLMLDRVSPGASDIVIATGDLVRKGPRPDLCLELWRDRRYLSVTGNNEERLLRSARGFFGRLTLPHEDRDVAGRRDLVAFMAAWPAVIDIPAIGATVVHGGLLPGMALSAETVRRHRDDLIRLRYIRRNAAGNWERVAKHDHAQSDVLWSSEWDGDRTVLYGHTPVREVRVNGRAIGLDTGCVYGGALSAAILDRGKWRFERVPALRAYAR